MTLFFQSLKLFLLSQEALIPDSDKLIWIDGVLSAYTNITIIPYFVQRLSELWDSRYIEKTDC